jgi:hypothetical protein
MVLRLKKSLQYRELIPTPDYSSPVPTFVPFYREYFAPPMTLTMTEDSFLLPQLFMAKEVHLSQLAT